MRNDLERLREGAGGGRSRGGLLLLLLLLAGALLSSASASAAAPSFERNTLYVFWSVDCPHCSNQKPFLEALDARHPDLVLRELEISRSAEFHDLFRAMAAARGIEPGFVPTLFFHDEVWRGDSPAIRAEIAQAVALALDPAAAEAPRTPPPAGPTLPGIGALDAEAGAIVVLTMLIAFIDGFNPCSLWVLTLLIGLVINARSRRRLVLVGVTFLATTATIYGAFVAGVFSVLALVLYLPWVQWLVAAVALVFGLVNVKDYFWYRRGLSFTIPEGQKPGIYRGLRGLARRELRGAALTATTIVLAAGIAVVELPCTAGFPVLWSGIVADRGLGGAEFALLLALYIAVYLSIELVVFFSALLTLSMGRLEERHGRTLKLFGGAVMIALALALVFRPDVVGSIGGTLVVFGLALLLASAVLMIHRRASRGWQS
jgi:cytochrome c biogenesis protein CcdA